MLANKDLWSVYYYTPRYITSYRNGMEPAVQLIIN